MIRIKKVNNSELERISGGGVEWFAVGLGIATFVIFVSLNLVTTFLTSGVVPIKPITIITAYSLR